MVTAVSKSSFASRLNAALDHAKYPAKGKGRQVQLAKDFDVSQVAAGKWLEGGSLPETHRIADIATRLKVNAEWLLTGRGAMLSGRANTEPAPSIASEVPLISWVRAGRADRIEDVHHPGHGEKTIYSTKRVGPHAFALRVKGDSMENPRGKPHYPEGSIILVDPDRSISSGKPVVARFNDQEEATFKMYVEDNGKQYLKPLNPQYPTIEIGHNVTLCGLVVQTIIDED